MSLYFKIVVLVLYIAGLVGVALPFLISSDSTELVFVGAGLAIVSAPSIYFTTKVILNKPKRENV